MSYICKCEFWMICCPATTFFNVNNIYSPILRILWVLQNGLWNLNFRLGGIEKTRPKYGCTSTAGWWVGFGMRSCGEMISWEFQSLQNGPTKVYSTSRILRWMVVLCGLFDGHRCSLPPFLVLEGGRLRLLRSGKGRGAGKWNISGTWSKSEIQYDLYRFIRHHVSYLFLKIEVEEVCVWNASEQNSFWMETCPVHARDGETFPGQFDLS